MLPLARPTLRVQEEKKRKMGLGDFCPLTRGSEVCQKECAFGSRSAKA